MTHDNKLQVEAIKRGTVIDHIPAQVGFKLLTLFKLTETDQRITIGLNLPSGEMGRKDLIKIENTFLTDEQVNQLSLYKTTVFVKDLNDFATVNATYEAFFTEHNATFPARSCVEVARLPKDVKIEIEAIAVRR